MACRELSVEVDERLIDALRRASARDGVAPDEVVEEALRRYFGLRGLAVLAEIAEAQRVQGVTPPGEDELMAQAVAEVRAYRNGAGALPDSAACRPRHAVLVSAALSPTSVPGQVVAAACGQRFELVVSPRLFDELSDVLRRPKFDGLPTGDHIDAFLEAIEEIALLVEDADLPEHVRDPDGDQPRSYCDDRRRPPSVSRPQWLAH